MAIEGYFELLLVIGAVLTFLISIFLWMSTTNVLPNRVLATLILSWSVMVTFYAIPTWEFFLKHPHFFGIQSCFALIIFPLIYLYVKTYLHEKAIRFLRFAVHFIPLISYIGAFSPFYFQSAEAKSIILESGELPDWLRSLKLILDITVIVQGILYGALSLRLLNHFKYFKAKRLSKLQLHEIKWLMQFVVIYIILMVIANSGALLAIINVSAPFDLFIIFYLGLPLLAIRLGYSSFKYPYLFSMENSIKKRSYINATKKKPYIDNNVSKQDIELLINYLEKEKIFLKNDMKMQDLADGTGMSIHRISELLNNEMKKSFNDLINEYRTKEAISLINEGMQERHTLTHLAEQAGFNSKATFNRVFKKETGKTPTEYIKDR